VRPLVSIIVLTHNKLPVTRTCLPTLLATAYAPWELIVVDNGSTDGTPAWLAAFAEQAAGHGVQVRVHANARNIGCSTARNQGLALARGAFFALLDNDVALRSRSWLTVLTAALAAPADGLAGPKIVYPHPPHRIQCAGVAISPAGRVQFRGRGEGRDDPRYSRREAVQCLISACWVMKREVIERAGGFDEAFNPVQFEDFDLCYRCLYVPETEMYHFESTTTAGTPTLANTRVIIRNGLRFKERWRHRFAAENGPPDAECRWRPLELPPFDEGVPLPPLP
jgi:GT2 family glycosyltransferase